VGATADGVRSSYGLGYDFQSASYLFISATAPPYSSRLRVNLPAGGFDDPYLNYPGGPPHPVPAVPGPDALFPGFGAFGAIDPDINSTRAQSWNAIVEQQIGSVWQASASYLGSHVDRIWGQVQVNPGVFLGLGPCTLNGVSYPVCTTDANLNQRRVLSLENPQAALLPGQSTSTRRSARRTITRCACPSSAARRWRRISGGYTRRMSATWPRQRRPGRGGFRSGHPAFDRAPSADRRHIRPTTA
jgi:hypothetical protein